MDLQVRYPLLDQQSFDQTQKVYTHNPAEDI